MTAPNQQRLNITGPFSGIGAGLQFNYSDTSTPGWEVLATGSAASEGSGKLKVRNLKYSVNVLTVDSNTDSVGIGTTNPRAALDIVAGNTGVQPLLFLGDNVGGSGDVAKIIYDAESSPFPLTLNLTSNTGFARPFAIVGGNVGVGTTTPLEKLQVAGRVFSQNLTKSLTATNVVCYLFSAEGHALTRHVDDHFHWE